MCPQFPNLVVYWTSNMEWKRNGNMSRKCPKYMLATRKNHVYGYQLPVLYYNYGCSYNIYFLAILSKRKYDFVFPSKNLSFGLIQEEKKYQYMFSQEKEDMLLFS